MAGKRGGRLPAGGDDRHGHLHSHVHGNRRDDGGRIHGLLGLPVRQGELLHPQDGGVEHMDGEDRPGHVRGMEPGGGDDGGGEAPAGGCPACFRGCPLRVGCGLPLQQVRQGSAQGRRPQAQVRRRQGGDGRCFATFGQIVLCARAGPRGRRGRRRRRYVFT